MKRRRIEIFETYFGIVFEAVIKKDAKGSYFSGPLAQTQDKIF